MTKTPSLRRRYTIEDILREETTPKELHDKIKSFVRKNPKVIPDLEEVIIVKWREEVPLVGARKSMGPVDVQLWDDQDNLYVIEVKSCNYNGEHNKIKEKCLKQVKNYYEYYQDKKVNCKVYLVGIEEGLLTSLRVF